MIPNKPNLLKKLFVCALLSFVLIQNISIAQVYVPIPVKGFTKDLIANGSSGTGNLTSVTALDGVDGEFTSTRYYYVSGFSWGGVTGKYGLPVSGLLTSTGFTGVNYQFAPYDSLNALKLSAGQSGTLSLLNPGIFSKISILASMGGPGPTSYGNFTAELKFSDGTSETATFTVPDWYNSNPKDASVSRIAAGGNGKGLGRVLYSGTWDDNSSAPFLFDNLFTISSKDKILQSIKFSESASDGGSYRIGIFAICGITSAGTPGTPVNFPIAVTTNITANSFKANWNALTDAIGYNLDVSTDPNFSTYVEPYNNYELSNVTNYTVTGLTSNTIYYYRLRARNTVGQGPTSDVMNLVTLSTGGTPPSNLQYASPKAYLINTVIAKLTPTVSGGAPVTYSINPGLPKGLTFNTTSGEITGTPIVLSAAKDYYVTAFNGAGNTQASINLAVVTPTINMTDTLKPFRTCTAKASDAQILNVSGSYLNDTILITCPTGYEISKDGTTYTTSIKLAATSGTVSNTAIYVRLTSSSSSGVSGNISFSSTGAATKNVATGTALITAPPSKPNIDWNGSQFSTASTTGIKYQWVLDNTNVSGANNTTYKPVATGVYYVLATDSVNNCKSASDTFRLNVTAVIERGMNIGSFKVYPNPVSNQLMVNLPKQPSSATKIELVTINGLIIKSLNTMRQQNIIDVSRITDGYYILKITNKDGVSAKKIFIEK